MANDLVTMLDEFTPMLDAMARARIVRDYSQALEALSKVEQTGTIAGPDVESAMSRVVIALDEILATGASPEDAEADDGIIQ